jgi:hypothetical protein
VARPANDGTTRRAFTPCAVCQPLSTRLRHHVELVDVPVGAGDDEGVVGPTDELRSHAGEEVAVALDGDDDADWRATVTTAATLRQTRTRRRASESASKGGLRCVSASAREG